MLAGLPHALKFQRYLASDVGMLTQSPPMAARSDRYVFPSAGSDYRRNPTPGAAQIQQHLQRIIPVLYRREIASLSCTF
jgi:hypothetical protein